MMPLTHATGLGDDRQHRDESATKIVLTAVFFGTIGAFALPVFRRAPVLRMGPMDLVLLGLTTFRVGNIVAYERIADPIREPFAARVSSRTGEELIEPRGRGVQRAVGELFACPICVGTWAAAGLVYGLHLAPRPTRAFMAIMSATGIAQLLKATIGALGALGEREAGPLPSAASPEDT